MTKTASKPNFFAIRARIAKAKAAAGTAGETTASASPRKRTATASRRRQAPTARQTAKPVVVLPAAIVEGTLSDIVELKSKRGTFHRAQFQVRDGEEYTSVTALISDAAKRSIGEKLQDGFIKLYGVMQGDTFRVVGLGREKRPAAPKLKDRPEVDYSYQRAAIFGQTA